MTTELSEAVRILHKLSDLVYSLDFYTDQGGYSELMDYIDDEVYEFLKEHRNEQ